MLLDLLGKLLPTRTPGPRHYRFGPETGILWSNFKNKQIISCSTRLKLLDTLLSTTIDNRVILYKVTKVSKEALPTGAIGWMCSVTPIEIKPDTDGFPILAN